MKLKFIKNWGTFKTGDILKDPSSVTVRALVDIYKVAEIEKEKGEEAVPPKEVSEKVKK